MTITSTFNQPALNILKRLGTGADAIAFAGKLAVQLARKLDGLNEDSCSEIRRRLSVAGNSRRGAKESMSGAYLYPHMISGNLRNSIGKTDAIISGSQSGVQLRAVVGSGIASGHAPVKYAGIQEFGGTIQMPARSAEWTRRNHEGVRHKKRKASQGFTVHIPPRSYLLSTMGERRAVYKTGLSETVVNFYKRMKSA